MQVSSAEEKLKRMNQFAEYEFERKYYHGPKYSIPEAGKGKKKEVVIVEKE